ncbi:MAG TPA: MEDS domain-containing protein [Dongiaceae bacterium]|nr:MEDS domain-containing protein [Dongiaceae bacterium]
MFRTSSLFHFNHGDHACVFYRNEESLREVLSPYIADGLRRGERCFCAQTPQICKQLLNDLRFLGIDTDQAIQRGALELHTCEEAYFPNGKFQPETMIELLLHSMEDAWRRGFTALRTAGELSWALEGKADCDQLLSYEKLVDDLFPGKAVTGLCQYRIQSFSPAILQSVVDAHRFHMSQENPRAFHTGITVRNGACWTEIVADKLVVNPPHYYVVQRREDHQVLGWGVAPTFDEANTQASRVIQSSC